MKGNKILFHITLAIKDMFHNSQSTFNLKDFSLLIQGF